MKPRIFSISFLLCLTFPLLCANADSIADRRTTSVQGGWDSERWLRQSESTAKALLKAVPDRYGPKQTPLWLSVIDPAAGGMVTVKPPNWQTYWDAEDYMMMAQGCNVYRDMPMLEALVRLSELSGVAAYRESVEACLGFFLSECVSETTGLFPWGEHLSYNTVRERIVAKRHELEHNLPVWDVLWRVNPEAVQREIEAIYRIHIYDKETFLYDRHGNYYTGEFDAAPVRGAYIKHSGLYAHSFAYLYSQTKEPKYLEWAEKISEVYWRHRDPKTGLLPGYVAPHGSGGNTLSSQMTLAYFLMRTVDLLRTVDPSAGSVIESHALAMVDSYLRYGFEPETGTFALTVIPSTGKPTGKVVEAWSRGENAYWQCMSACWEAYRRTKNPKYLEVMEIGARTAANTPIPDKVAPEPVGLWIELFGKIYTVTGNEEYLRYARSLAEWSCEHLLRNDLILESASGYVYHNYSSPGSLVQGWLSLYELEREVALHWTAPESIHPSAGEVVVTAAAGDVGEGLGLRWKLRDGQTGNVQGTKQNDTIVFTVRLPGETPEGPLGFEFVQKGSGEVVGTGQSLVAENPAGPVVGPWRLPEWTDREMSLRGSVKVTDETGLVTVVCHYRLPDGRQGQLPCMPNPDEDSWYRFSIPAAGRDVSGETALWIEARGNPEWPISTVTTEQVVPLSAGERSTVHHRSGELFSLSSANGQVRFTLVPDADIRFGAVRVESIPVEAVTARTGLPEKTLSNVVRVSLDGAVRAGGEARSCRSPIPPTRRNRFCHPVYRRIAWRRTVGSQSLRQFTTRRRGRFRFPVREVAFLRWEANRCSFGGVRLTAPC